MNMQSTIVTCCLCLCFFGFGASDSCRIRDREKFRLKFCDGYPQIGSEASGSWVVIAGRAEVRQDGQWQPVSPSDGWRHSGWYTDMSWTHPESPAAARYIAGIEGARAILAGLHTTEQQKYYDDLDAGAWPTAALKAFLQWIVLQ